ncbi:MAG TPA: DUF433 domain-containing protein [Gammaproteobacteria bacterium]|nr:DUF433 domain-containing protein [Gammaproteobacteria bacterium]
MYVWDIPRYTPAEAGRLTGLRPERVRRWLRGYSYSYVSPMGKDTTLVHQRPVIKQRDAEDTGYASFLGLVDLLFVRQFLDRGFSLQRIRKALAEAESIIGGHHQRVYFTDGREIYLRVKGHGTENLLQLLSGGQWVISDVILDMARQVDFDQETGFAEKWFPAGRQAGVVVDPRICFGAPTIVGRGVRTSNVYDLFVAEREDTQVVSKWMNLREQEVESAVKFERALAA